MLKNSLNKYIILGAGLSGLSLGYFLKKKGFDNFLILEKEKVPGGLCRTEKINKFYFDYTGHLLHFKKKEIYDFVSNLIFLKKNFRKAFIYSNSLFTNYPFQENTYGLPDDVRYECLKGFIDSIFNKKKYHNFKEWILSSFGAGIAKYFMFPYNEKLFRYPLDKITLEWFSRFIPKPGLIDVLEGAFFKKRSHLGYNSIFYYPENTGISSLPCAMYESIKENVKLGTQAVKINLRKQTIMTDSGEEIGYKKLYSSIPVNDLLNFTGIQEFQKLSGYLRYTSVINFNIGFDKNYDNLRHWIYFPEKKYSFYRVGFHSNFNKIMAPKNQSSVYIEIAKTNSEKIEIEKEYNKAIKDLNEVYHFTIKNIVARKDIIISPAYVIYNKDRTPVIKKITSRLNKKNVFLIGRFGKWEYSTMEDAISDSMKLVKDIQV